MAWRDGQLTSIKLWYISELPSPFTAVVKKLEKVHKFPNSGVWNIKIDFSVTWACLCIYSSLVYDMLSLCILEWLNKSFVFL